MPTMITRSELAKLLRVDDRTVDNWRKRKLLPPPFACGNTVRWREEVIREWMTKREVERG